VPLVEEHLDALADIVRDPAVRRFTPVPDPVPDGWVRDWFASYVPTRERGTVQAFAIVEPEGDGSCIGLAIATHIDHPARTAELAYNVAPAHRGRGVATAAVTLLSRWAFDELGMMRLELRIDVRNEASRAVARHCGYVLEGVLRSLHLRGDERVDTELWSRLASDP
jgi:RimJ/RimL family protein N-acetyltransferase